LPQRSAPQKYRGRYRDEERPIARYDSDEQRDSEARYEQRREVRASFALGGSRTLGQLLDHSPLPPAQPNHA